MDVREIDFLSGPVVLPQTVFESTPRDSGELYRRYFEYLPVFHLPTFPFMWENYVDALTDEQIAEARKEVGGIKPTYKEADPEYPEFPTGWETRNAPN